MKLHVKVFQLALSASVALTIAACDNKEVEMKERMQSKLEQCFARAEATSFQDIDTQWKNAKCDAFDALLRDGKLQCGNLIKLRKEGQAEAEAQCMKLYKN